MTLRQAIAAIAVLLCALSAAADSSRQSERSTQVDERFDKCFRDTTLRLDYMLGAEPGGNVTIRLRDTYRTDGWYGRRVNLDYPVWGTCALATMCDAETGDTLYATSFATLFDEWLVTPEAQTTARAMEHTLLMPMPRKPATVTVELFDNRFKRTASITHPVDPDDILIRHLAKPYPEPVRVEELHTGGDPKTTIDITILAEGYTAEETELFMEHARKATTALLTHSPFTIFAERFNIRAVATPSRESGISIPRLGQWVDTPFDSHFSTFYSDRYLTSPHPSRMHDALAGIPYEHIIVLANTPEYGGGGIYNAYTLTSGGHPTLPPVVVHEFGHSFAGLADEYFYQGDVMDDTYPTDVEPWNPNITTLTDFGSKWSDLLGHDTPVPTPAEDADKYELGVFEGAGYSFKGVYRPADRCRMRDNDYPKFCMACARAIIDVIDYHTVKVSYPTVYKKSHTTPTYTR